MIAACVMTLEVNQCKHTHTIIIIFNVMIVVVVVILAVKFCNNILVKGSSPKY